MKKIYNLILLVTISLVFVSCGTDDGQGFYIGKSKSYRDFLWSKYDWDKVVLPTQSLQLEVGELQYTQPIKLQVVYRDENGDYLPVNSSRGRYITIFQNGKPLKGSDIVIRPTDTLLDLQFRFDKAAAPGTYELFMRILECGDLDMINGEEAKVGNIIGSGIKWQVQYEEVMNPLVKGLIWMGIITLILLVLWFAMLRRIIFPVFAFDNLRVFYFEGENRIGHEDCSLRGARKIICDKSPKYQSKLNKIFCGRIEYLTNSFWKTPVEMKSCGADGISVNEELKAGEKASGVATYRMPAMITAQNGPRRPFVVKLTGVEKMANIFIG